MTADVRFAEKRLTQEEINKRLHMFNLTNNWSVFDDVPESQFVDVMYPTVLRFGLSDDAYKQQLNKLFGPL